MKWEHDDKIFVDSKSHPEFDPFENVLATLKLSKTLPLLDGEYLTLRTLRVLGAIVLC